MALQPHVVQHNSLTLARSSSSYDNKTPRVGLPPPLPPRQQPLQQLRKQKNQQPHQLHRYHQPTLPEPVPTTVFTEDKKTINTITNQPFSPTKPILPTKSSYEFVLSSSCSGTTTTAVEQV